MENTPALAIVAVCCLFGVGFVVWLVAVNSSRKREKQAYEEEREAQKSSPNPLDHEGSLSEKNDVVLEALVRASEPEALREGPPVSRPVDLVSLRSIPLDAAMPVRDLVALESTEIPKVIGSYVLSDSLGRGRLGVVHKAFRVQERQEVAMKFLPAAIADQEEFMVFLRERVSLLTSVDHPNVGKVFDTGRVVGRPFLVMECIEGFSFEARLTEYIEMGGGPFGEVVDVALSVSEALVALHTKGVPHGDLRPANVMRVADGRVVLCEGAVLPPACRSLVSFAAPFMSESLLSGHPLRPEDDLFAFGAFVYMLLCLRVPYPTNKRSESPVPIALMRPNTPLGLASVVDDCIALGKVPYGTASELRAETVHARLLEVRDTLQRDDESWSRAASMNILFSQADVLMDDETDLGDLLLSTSERLDQLIAQKPAPLKSSEEELFERDDAHQRVQNVESPLFEGLFPGETFKVPSSAEDEELSGELPLVAVTSAISVTESWLERSEGEDTSSFDDIYAEFPTHSSKETQSKAREKRASNIETLLDEYLKEP